MHSFRLSEESEFYLEKYIKSILTKLVECNI
jgi:hypothetical protein